MNTTPVTIENGQVTIRPEAGNVWLTEYQIAGLFNVFVSAVTGNIRSILKNDVLREEKVCRYKKTENGHIMTLYNLEMITALSFRLKSQQAEWFRRWITGQVLNPVMLWKIPGMNAILN
jgi:hypothetical protein